MGVIEAAHDIARQDYDCTLTYRSVAAPHRLPFQSPDHSKVQTKRGRSVAISNHGVNQMNSDEVNWLLQTIEDPENAERFVQAQYQRGRIPYHVMASLARDRNWADWPAVEKPDALFQWSVLRHAPSVDLESRNTRSHS